MNVPMGAAHGDFSLNPDDEQTEHPGAMPEQNPRYSASTDSRPGGTGTAASHDGTKNVGSSPASRAPSKRGNSSRTPRRASPRRSLDVSPANAGSNSNTSGGTTTNTGGALTGLGGGGDLATVPRGRGLLNQPPLSTPQMPGWGQTLGPGLFQQSPVRMGQVSALNVPGVLNTNRRGSAGSAASSGLFGAEQLVPGVAQEKNPGSSASSSSPFSGAAAAPPGMIPAGSTGVSMIDGAPPLGGFAGGQLLAGTFGSIELCGSNA